MLQIAILDDQKTDAENLKEVLLPYFSHRQDPYTFTLFHDGTSLLESKTRFDILFLDIEVGEENGIEIAKELRKRLTDCFIIVVTSYAKYSLQGYKIQAARYLLKPIVPSLLYSELDEVLQDYKRQKIQLQNQREDAVWVAVSELSYIEAYERKTMFHADKESYSHAMGVQYWGKQLADAWFVECYKGIYVNVAKIKQLGKDTLHLQNGGSVPVARRRYENVYEAWMKYHEEQL